MKTVDDILVAMDKKWAVMLWADIVIRKRESDSIDYHALAIEKDEIIRGAMNQGSRPATGSTPFIALQNMIEKTSDKSKAAEALSEVAAHLVRWHDECMRVDKRSPLPGGLVSDARKALELAR